MFPETQTKKISNIKTPAQKRLPRVIGYIESLVRKRFETKTMDGVMTN